MTLTPPSPIYHPLFTISYGPTVLKFGTDWCGYCQDAQPVIAKAFAAHPSIAHIKVEDGPGRPLGRSFRVKLWPTLVFLKDGKEAARLVRPESLQAIERSMQKIEPRRTTPW
jgi:thioredoxin 1